MVPNTADGDMEDGGVDVLLGRDPRSPVVLSAQDTPVLLDDLKPDPDQVNDPVLEVRFAVSGADGMRTGQDQTSTGSGPVHALLENLIRVHIAARRVVVLVPSGVYPGRDA